MQSMMRATPYNLAGNLSYMGCTISLYKLRAAMTIKASSCNRQGELTDNKPTFPVLPDHGLEKQQGEEA